MPGKPLVYATSKTFMDYFGINSAADLPKLKEVFAETLIEPTIISTLTAGDAETETIAGVETGEESHDGTPLLVSEQGELREGAAEIPPDSDTGEDLAPEYPEAAEEPKRLGNPEESDEQTDEPSDADYEEIAEAEITEARMESEAEGPDEAKGESDEEDDEDAAHP